MKRLRRTKIVATLGPASSSPEMIETLIHAGVNVFRLNFSHGSRDVHHNNVAKIREISDKLDKPIAILQDLQGPKIRTATFAEGKITLKEGQTFKLTCDDDSPGDETRVGVTYTNLCSDVAEGDSLLLDDGRLALKVRSIQDSTIITTVILGGVLSNNKGINIPEAELSIPALTDKDVEDLRFGVELDVDWVAMSFVRSRDDILIARHHLSQAGSNAKLMAKIEKPGAVERFEEVLREVDGIMVARGDLGVEMPPERVPIIQKRLINACIEAGKPVVTATQMLESMINNPRPTRAEASDVANAIYDGTDAVMLSAETAVGEYPEEAVKIMARIALSVEGDPQYRDDIQQRFPKPDETIADSVSLGACQMAHSLAAPIIVCFSSSGATALRVSRNRPDALILTITPNRRSYRQLGVAWGVLTYMSDEISSVEEMVDHANQAIRIIGKRTGADAMGERYVITAGVPFGRRGSTNLIRVERAM